MIRKVSVDFRFDVPVDVPVLDGSLVRLEPLSMAHAEDLKVAVEEDRSTYQFTYVPGAQEVEGYIATQLSRAQAGEIVPFAQIRHTDGRAVGHTTYRDPRPWPERPGLCAIEIGGTWLAGPAQRSGINVEAKLLLMQYAFETLAVARVDLKTDARNERSRRAIAGLGAHFEGVLRNWGPSHAPGEEGWLRDSALFSVVAPEWPEVKATLTSRLRRTVNAHRG
jgi:RimJ/RimL family protein N-acetyltransferase